MRFSVPLSRLLDARGLGLQVETIGPRVVITLAQEVFDADGNARGVCRVAVEGRRGFGAIVTFERPTKVMVTNAIPGEEEAMQHMGRLMVEVLTESPVSTAAAPCAGA